MAKRLPDDGKKLERNPGLIAQLLEGGVAESRESVEGTLIQEREGEGSVMDRRGHVFERHAGAFEIVNPTRSAHVTRREHVSDKGCQHSELDQSVDVGGSNAGLMGHLLARMSGHEKGP